MVTLELFNKIKSNYLKNMPSGMVVAKDELSFDVGHWNFKSYDDNNDIKGTLKRKWCSTIINILFLDGDITKDNIHRLMDDLDFIKFNRNTYLVYIIAIPEEHVNEEVVEKLKSPSLSINRFTLNFKEDGYVLFLNDFIKNIIKL